jgi:hypothetical protein
MNGIPISQRRTPATRETFRKGVSGSEKLSEAFAAKIDGYVKTLEGFGIRMVPAAELSRASAAAVSLRRQGRRPPHPGNRKTGRTEAV